MEPTHRAYTGLEKDQIDEDVFHVNNSSGENRTIWIFLEQGPTEPLRQKFIDNGIDYIQIIE